MGLRHIGAGDPLPTLPSSARKSIQNRMSSGVLTLPELQLEPLVRAYAQARARQRLQASFAGAILVVFLIASFFLAEVRPTVLIQHADRMTDYIARIFHLENHQPVWSDPREWFWGFSKWTKLIGETITIAYLGTALGALGAYLQSFFAAENLVSNRLAMYGVRRFLEFCRTVPELVFALLFVAAFGLGPLPGILAITIHTLGALGKQCSEVVENADMKTFEGVVAAGGSWVEAVRFAIVPQVMSNFASYGLLRFEINVRESAILGFVGAGGIGADLLVAVRRFYYSDVSAIVLMIIATVAILDLIAEQIRHRLIGGGHDR